MGLLSIFQRNKQTSANSGSAAKLGRGGKSAARQAPLANTQNPADTAEAVREARARARTRLMGATVLLLVGVIGFPLLFETQPRPIPVDLPIEIPARNAPGVVDAHSGVHARAAQQAVASAPPLIASGALPESVSYDSRTSAPAAASEPASEPAPRRSAFAKLAAVLTSGAAGTVAAPVAAASKPTPVAAASKPVAAASKPAPVTHGVLPPPPAVIVAETPPPKPSDAASGRFVVQVGAFLDDAKVRDTRAKVEKLGMKTYTQPVDTPTGKRIRVRVGPYATKAEAEKSATRLKGDGLQAVVLSL